MALQLHTLNSPKRRRSRRVGRGHGSGRGTYAGRGLKGQKARSGGKRGNNLRGLRSSLLKVPKVRGKNSVKVDKQVVTISVLNRICTDGATVSPVFLKNKGFINNPRKTVKILAGGEMTKKIIIKGCLLSKGASEAIEKAGGKIIF